MLMFTGQFKFNFKHAAISRDDSKRFLDGAFWRDYQANGPSLYRIARTLLAGWKRYKDWPHARVRERFAHEMLRLSGIYSSAPLGDGAPVPESRRTGQSANPYSERKVQA